MALEEAAAAQEELPDPYGMALALEEAAAAQDELPDPYGMALEEAGEYDTLELPDPYGMALEEAGETDTLELVLGQKLSYHDQYASSSSLQQLLWMHLSTSVFPQS